MDLFDLNGKTAIVFGGNGVLGKQFCAALLEYGAKVYSCDVNTTITDDTRSLKDKFPNKFEIIAVNAADKPDLLKFKKNFLVREKKLDVIVNSTTMKSDDFYLPFEDVSLEGWNTGLLGNLTIPFLTTQIFIPIMRKQREGSIINIGSVYGIVGNDQRLYIGANFDKLYVSNSPEISQIHSHGVYNAAKGGLISFTRYLAAYYGEYNIRVNCISPGGIYSDKDNEISLRKYCEKVPMGRRAYAHEINGALIFLASNASSYITGHNLVVDGGFTIW